MNAYVTNMRYKYRSIKGIDPTNQDGYHFEEERGMEFESKLPAPPGKCSMVNMWIINPLRENITTKAEIRTTIINGTPLQGIQHMYVHTLNIQYKGGNL